MANTQEVEVATRTKSDFISIPDADHGFPLSMFAVPKHYLATESLLRVLIPHGVILNRIEKIAQDIVELVNGPLVLICVLKGGHQVFADLSHFIKKLNNMANRPLPLSLQFIRSKSYHNDVSRDCEVVNLVDEAAVRGQHVMVVEDMIDTGRSIQQVLAEVSKFGPKSVRSCSLLVKKSARFRPDFIGFEIPDEFVVGYALDYNEYFRDLDHLCVLSEKGKEIYKK
eukprot:comp11549_c0_seq1/m.6011 comp11549_c0_seq1/g.6011  ORF comp11549_c0_seq1/g.6011 comp11549_c0_seq1/m.6011 type:complete len:226 (-) comp11549_c0_seq1:137-814(-)